MKPAARGGRAALPTGKPSASVLGRRVLIVVVAGAVAAAIAVGAGACSDDGGAVCGDGRATPPEQCDDGNTNELDACRRCLAYFAPRNVVKWTFNAAAAPGFSSDGCSDVAAETVRVDLSGPAAMSKTAACEQFQVTFDELPAGSYTAAVTPLDQAGAALVAAPPSAPMDANLVPSTTTETIVNVPPPAWSRPMTGTFFFFFRWAGMTCPTAAPPVATQLVTLTIGGVPVTAMTVALDQLPAYRVDGTQPVGCVMASSTLAERIETQPFGPARIAISGRDSGGAEMFRGSFDTFIGAGRTNPIFEFDVASTIDAGIDAPIDAPVDAPDIDAGVDAPIDAEIDAP